MKNSLKNLALWRDRKIISKPLLILATGLAFTSLSIAQIKNKALKSEQVPISKVDKVGTAYTKVYKNVSKGGELAHTLVLHFPASFEEKGTYQSQKANGNTLKGHFTQEAINGNIIYHLKDETGKNTMTFMCSGNDVSIFELNDKKEKIQVLKLNSLNEHP